jgi:hypothetical protein
MTNEAHEKEIFDIVVKYVSHNERVAWKRRHKNFSKKILSEVTPIEDEILELTMKKMFIMDELEEDRQNLIASCVHPKEFLRLRENHVYCIFCDTKITVNFTPETDEEE